METPVGEREKTFHRRSQETAGPAHEGAPGLQIPAPAENQDPHEEGQVHLARWAAGSGRQRDGDRGRGRGRAGRRSEPAHGQLRRAHERLDQRGLRHDAGPAGLPAPGAERAQPEPDAVHAPLRYERPAVQLHDQLPELYERLPDILHVLFPANHARDDRPGLHGAILGGEVRVQQLQPARCHLVIPQGRPGLPKRGSERHDQHVPARGGGQRTDRPDQATHVRALPERRARDDDQRHAAVNTHVRDMKARKKRREKEKELL